VIQRGAGTALYRAHDGSTQASAFQQNDTLVIPPNLIHQV
jgi:oxalate decarboxylase/phosphoglucose isomerase-like protein (cupin superfamily)